MRKPCMQALRMLRPLPPAPANEHSDRQRHLGLAAEHIMPLGGLVADLIHRGHRKLEPHVGHDRTHPDQARAKRYAGHGVLRHRHVEHALLAMLLLQPLGRAEHADRVGHTEAHEIGAAVAIEADIDCLVDGFGKFELAIDHGGTDQANMCRLSSLRSGNGLARAKATASSISSATLVSIAACAASSIKPLSSSTLRYKRSGQRVAQESNSACVRYPRWRSPSGPQCSSQR